MKKKLIGSIFGVLAVVVVIGAGIVYFTKGVPVHAGVPTVKIISQPQYANTIGYIFGPDIEIPPQFPPVSRVDGMLALGATEATFTPGLVDRFYRYGKQVAEQVLSPERQAYLVPCSPADPAKPDPHCARQFIEQTGVLLFRRTLDTSEVDKFAALAAEAAEEVDDFYQGLKYVLTGMLVSPSFILISDRLDNEAMQSGETRLDPYSKASRLSFFLWNSGPDRLLMEAAAAGELDTREGLQRQAERMLASPRFEAAIRGFFSDMLRFDEFENLAKDNLIYPAYSPAVSGEAAEQMLRMIAYHLIDNQGDYRDLYTTRTTFMSKALGAVYRVPVDPDNEFTRYQFPEGSGRAGLLTHVGFLSLHSHPGRSSPTIRGEGVRDSLLCQPVPLPPPNVDFSNFEDPAGEFKTARERLVRHSTDPTCANCHKITDPIGLGLENFDGAGQFRSHENGALIDASGVLDGISFSDAVSLGAAVKKNPATTACLTERMFAYGINRPTTREDQPMLDYLENEFAEQGYRIQALMKSIVMSDAFFAVRAPAVDEPVEIASAH
ncbi:MAG: hypothetical protein CMK32_02710 [Porticoccaceae bacterium]|nr:hypothetical protein [Porticoccaceae bacterium]